QSSGPLRLAILDGLDVSDGRLGNVPRRYNAAPRRRQQDQQRYAQNAFHGCLRRLVTLSATRCFYYFFMVVVIRHKTKATACRALTFIVRIFVNDTIAIAVWTSFDTITIAVWISFHVCVCLEAQLVLIGSLSGSGKAAPDFL